MFAALLSASVPLALAQAVDTSAGGVQGSAASRTVAPVPNPAPARLTASIQPVDQSVATSGELVFVVVGDAVSVSGRIAGLDPNKRYQAVVRLPLNPLAVQRNPPSQQETPDGDPPQESAPSAPAPAAGSEGTPDIARRAPQANLTGALTPSLEMDLGMMVSDARGITNLAATLMNQDLTQPPNGIQGCTVVIKRAPPLDSREERSPVGTGVIFASDHVIPVPSGP